MAEQRDLRSVFINCPFDPAYQPLFSAVLFAVCVLGFEPRSALEVEDSSDLRLEKIYALIESCPFSIHDLSRTELSEKSKFPRFNMPLELGIFLGAKRFGPRHFRKKKAVIFAKDQFVKTFISDINGMDINGHGDQPANVIAPIRHFLVSDQKRRGIPASVIEKHFAAFETDLPSIVDQLGYKPEEPQYGDLLEILREWLEAHPVSIRNSA
jgi:hypothetical protein